MNKKYCFILKMLDANSKTNNFDIEVVDPEYISKNQIKIKFGEEHVLVEYRKWKYATSWFWLPLGDFYIEADGIEDAIRMALFCAKDFICDESRVSTEVIKLMTELYFLIQSKLFN